MPLTPDTDAALRELGTYLEAALNAVQPGSIASVHEYDCFPSDPAAYPALILYRRSSVGEEFNRCRAIVRYAVYSQASREERPGLFRYVEKLIALKLRDYNESTSAPSLKIVSLDNLRSDYRIAQAQALIPFIEIEFEFIDWVEL